MGRGYVDTTCHATSALTWCSRYFKGATPLYHLSPRVPSSRTHKIISLPESTYTQSCQPLGLQAHGPRHGLGAPPPTTGQANILSDHILHLYTPVPYTGLGQGRSQGPPQAWCHTPPGTIEGTWSNRRSQGASSRYHPSNDKDIKYEKTKNRNYFWCKAEENFCVRERMSHNGYH